MIITTHSSGEGLEAKLKAILDNVDRANAMQVGFLEGSTYPDGTSVPMVAAIQEFGAPAAGIPARPFFRNMVEAKSSGWAKSLGEVAKLNDYDMEITLGLMGAGIGSQLIQSIKDTNSPPLSKVTLMLKKMKREDQSLVVTGKVVGEAAARVAAGESVDGEAAKPLNDTGHLQNSVYYEVDAGQRKHVDPQGGAAGDEI